MPWRGPSYDGEFPSLGWGVLKWAQKHFRVPDGPYAGEPLKLTDEQIGILVRFYALDDRGRFIFRRGAVRRPQGAGKSPLLGLISLAELCGPSRFDAWSSEGEPIAKRPTSPLVQVVACSEDQASNTYDAIYEMAKESALNGSIMDVGRMKILLVNEPGRLEPVTSAAGTRLGQRVTFSCLDETHLWLKQNGGHRLAATIRRNVGKMNGRTFESTNAHLPGEDSVAERTFKAHVEGAAGLLYDSREGPPVDDLTNREAVLAALAAAYGDAVKWVDINRIADEIADPSTDPQDARRFYFNQLVAGADQFIDIQAWERLASERIVEPGESIGLGFDGSISDDRTCLYGCTRDGFVFELGVWETRQGETMIRRSEVHDAVREAFATYEVGLMLCDPPKWWSEIEQWAKEHGDEGVVALDTNQARRFAPLCDRFATEVRQGSISHDGKPLLTAHLASCARKNVRLADDASDGRSRFVIVKADTRKIDAAVAAVLAREAAATMPERGESAEPWVAFS